MALNMLNLKSTVGLTKRICPNLVQVAKYSWEPKEVETHTGQVSCLTMTLSRKIIWYLIDNNKKKYFVLEMGKG